MPDLFRFDFGTGFITMDGTPRQVWALCGHLRGPLGKLLSNGAAVVCVSTAANGSGTDLAVSLSRGPALADVAVALRPLDPDVSPWSRGDGSEGVALGLACRYCRQTIAWPQEPRPS
jgi:hypothetical protein